MTVSIKSDNWSAPSALWGNARHWTWTVIRTLSGQGSQVSMKNWVQIFSAHIKSQTLRGTLYNPALRRQSQEEPWDSPASQPSQIFKVPASRTKADERQPRLTSGLHVRAYTDLETLTPCTHKPSCSILSLTNILWFLPEAICGGESCHASTPGRSRLAMSLRIA